MFISSRNTLTDISKMSGPSVVQYSWYTKWTITFLFQWVLAKLNFRWDWYSCNKKDFLDEMDVLLRMCLVSSPPCHQVLLCAQNISFQRYVLIRPVVSDSATPCTVVCQAPLSMGILQARILEWIATPFSRGSSPPRDGTQVSHVAGGFFTIWATSKAHSKSVVV